MRCCSAVSGLPSPGPPARSASYCATQRRTAVSTRSIDRLTSPTDKPWSRTIRTTSSLKLASNCRRLLVIYCFSSSIQDCPPIDLSEEIRPLQSDAAAIEVTTSVRPLQVDWPSSASYDPLHALPGSAIHRCRSPRNMLPANPYETGQPRARKTGFPRSYCAAVSLRFNLAASASQLSRAVG